jgi:signal transduction histidine kinase
MTYGTAAAPRDRKHRTARTDHLLPDHSVWARTMHWWHVAFYAALAVLVLFILTVDSDQATDFRLLGALAVLGAAYPFLTRRQDMGTWRPRLYLGILVAVITFLAFTSNAGLMVLFIAFPQIWMFSQDRRLGLVLTGLVCVLIAAGQITMRGLNGASVAASLVQSSISFIASTALGLWIYKIIEQSEERAELLARLDAAQSELASAHKAQGALMERERIAREIHDTLAQGFTSIVMLTEAAQAQLRKDPATSVADRLEAIQSTARDNLQEARALIAASGPAPLQGGDLLGALHRLGSAFPDGGRTALALELPRVLPPLTPVQQVAVLRTAQEALTNVRRHAQATTARLALALDSGVLSLTVDDDGVGFDPDSPREGFGLRSMAARIAEIGGSMRVASAPGRGTRVSVSVPVDPDGA